MEELRRQIVQLLIEYDNNEEYPGDLPDRILAIPEIAEALANQPSEYFKERRESIEAGARPTNSRFKLD